MDAEQTLRKARALMTQYDSVYFVGRESGMRRDEMRAWQDRLLNDLRHLLGSRVTCEICGTQHEQAEECSECHGDPFSTPKGGDE